MKKILIPVSFVLSLLSSCSVISELTKFDLPLEHSVNIPKAIVISGIPVDIYSTEIETNSDDFLKQNNINADLIDKITLRKMELIVSTPTYGNFNFTDSIEISILSDSLPEIRIASLDEIQADAGGTLKLIVDPIDVKQYILKKKIKLKIKMSVNEGIPTDYIVDLKPTFLIDLKVIGL
ncbi:MAG: hypothetical protein WC542_15730 [Paludibacter sp.]